MTEFEQDDDCHVISICLIGDYGVGKTSMITRYCNGHYADKASLVQPAQVAEHKHVITLQGGEDSIRCLLNITDTAGQEQFRSFTSSYFRNRHGFLVVFDVGNRESFDNAVHWIDEVRSWDQQYLIVLVGNKCDQPDRQVVYEEAASLCERLALHKYVESSAKLGTGCDDAFLALATQCYNQYFKQEDHWKKRASSDGAVALHNTSEHTGARTENCNC